MSAQKYFEKQSMIYNNKQDQLGDIERLKSICFPKTPKTSSTTSQNQLNNNSILMNSGGKFNSSKINFLSKQPQAVQFNTNNGMSSPTQTQIKRNLNRSLDNYNSNNINNHNGSAFFGKENEMNYEEQSFNEYANNSGGMYGSNKKRQSLRNISQNQFNTSAIHENINNNGDDQNYPRKRSDKKNLSYNHGRNNNNNNNQNKIDIQYDYFEPTTRSIQIDSANPSGLIQFGFNTNNNNNSNNGLRKVQVVENTPISQSNIMKEMVEFIRKVGCELNDLCLTKMSEKTLQTMIEKHLSDVGRMQSLFQETLREKEPNITLALNVISKCFEELVEKLGDLITRLRMFNKRKFKNLVEQSLASTLKEVFEENNKLNILEIITDINVFVNQQRKSLYFWKLSYLLEQRQYKNKSLGLYSIIDFARQKNNIQIQKSYNFKYTLQKALLISQNILQQQKKQAFYKWQYTKQIQKQIEGEMIEGISRLELIFNRMKCQRQRQGYISILQNLKNYDIKQNNIKKIILLIKDRIQKNKQYAFYNLRKNQFAFSMNKNESIQRIKILYLIKTIESIKQKKQSDSIQSIQSYLQKRDKQLLSLNRIQNIFEQRNKQCSMYFLNKLTNIKDQNKLTNNFKGIILSKYIQRVFQTRLQETFNQMKTELFVRPQPIKLVFKAVNEALDKIDNPSLQNILRTIDVCFSNKKITKHLINLRSIQYVILNMNTKEITQLNPIWKKLENSQLENEQIYYINQVINKDTSFEKGFETLNYPIISTNLSSRDNKSVQTILIPLNLHSNSSSYLACETVCSQKMNEEMISKITKIGKVIKSRLKENYLKEKLHLNNCKNIFEKHTKFNIQKYYSLWKSQIYERLITEKDLNTEKANGLEKQLLSYKVELEKNKLHSSNIMKELGLKRDEIIEIETRLEDLTIEKKAKSKCLATALFSNFIEKRQIQKEQIKRSFMKWVDYMTQKRIATVACQQIEEINTKHTETRFSSALYLLKHFQDSYQKRLKIYTLKYLAYNSVCNNSQLNFSQFNNNINRSSTPTNLSPNISMSKKKQQQQFILSKNNQTLSQNSLIGGNTLDPHNYSTTNNNTNLNQPSLSEMSQINGQSESALQINQYKQQQSQQIQGQNSLFETPLPSPLNCNLSQSMLQDTKHKPFFSSAGGANKSNLKNPLQNLSNSKKNTLNNNSMVQQNQQQQQQQLSQQKQLNFAQNNQNNIFNQQQNLFMKKNDSSQNILTEDSTSQPPIQLQPTQITNPLLSNTSRTGGNTHHNNNSSSTSSLVNLNMPQQLQQQQQNQIYSMTSQKYNPRSNSNNHYQQQQQQQQYYSNQNENIYVQQQQPDSRSSNSNSNLHNSFNNFYRPPLHTQDLFDSSQQNIQTGNSSTYRGVGLNKSFSGYNTINTNNNSSVQNTSKQPSNLGYRLSAKTINFLQKFGRNSSTESNKNIDTIQGFGNTSSSFTSNGRIAMSNSQLHNNNNAYHMRNKSANQDFSSVSSRNGDYENSFYKKY